MKTIKTMKTMKTMNQEERNNNKVTQVFALKKGSIKKTITVNASESYNPTIKNEIRSFFLGRKEKNIIK